MLGLRLKVGGRVTTYQVLFCLSIIYKTGNWQTFSEMYVQQCTYFSRDDDDNDEGHKTGRDCIMVTRVLIHIPTCLKKQNKAAPHSTIIIPVRFAI